MRQTVLFSFRFLLLVSVLVLFFQFSSGPPPASTGAPGDGNCMSCHSVAGSQTGSIEIGGIPSTIVPNTTYNLTVTVNLLTGSAIRAGFQLVALDGNIETSPSIGTFSNLEPSFVQTSTLGNRVYLEHDNDKFFGANSFVTFTADWTAPATATDNIFIYAIGNVANGSTNQFDKIVLTNMGPVPLPVELVDFNVQQISEKELELNWKTLSEQNSAYFNVLRSKNGVDYENIGSINAAGHSGQPLSYRYVDQTAPSNRTIYYRLQQFDLDDRMSYSSIRAAQLLQIQKTEANVFPNPVSIGECLFIESVATESLNQPELHIYKQDGSLAYQDFTPTLNGFTEGYNMYVIESSNWEKGLYYLCISENGKPVITKSFIVID